MSGVPSGTHVFPPLEVRNVLRENWDASNMSLDASPYVHTGWYDDTSGDEQVTVDRLTETGAISGLDAETGNPVVDVIGSVMVGCWGGELVDETPNAKQIAHEFREEVRRIIHGYMDGIKDGNGNRKISRLGDEGATWVPDTDRNPPVVRYDVSVAYLARKRPPE